MFPLGAILFPYNVLPLRVFEPRYRMLTHDCLEGNKEFGVVLIERGFEVGGGDDRFGLGTVARIVQAAQTVGAGTYNGLVSLNAKLTKKVGKKYLISTIGCKAKKHPYKVDLTFIENTVTRPAVISDTANAACTK